MGKLIEKLPKSIDLNQIKEEWLKIGLSTELVDKNKAEAALDLVYECAGLAPPTTKIWLQSPFSGAVAAHMLDQVRGQVWDQVWDQVRGQVWGQVRGQVMDQVGDQVWDQVWDQVGGQVWDQVMDQVGDQVRGQVRDQVGDQVWDQVRDQVWGQVRGQVWDRVRGRVWDQVRDQVGRQVMDQVWGQVGDQVRDQVMDQVGDQVRDQVRGQVRDQVRGQVRDQVRDQVRGQARDQVWDQVGNQVRDQVWDQVGNQVMDQVWDQVMDQGMDRVRDRVRGQVWRAIYGSQDAAWLGFYKAFEDLVPKTDMLSGLWGLAKTCGWCWPFENVAVLTERPCELHMELGQLHNESGAAIKYTDNFTVYAWRGVRVPKKWIEKKEAIKPQQILKETNVEKRRVLIEIYTSIHGEQAVLKDLEASLVDEDVAHNQSRKLYQVKDIKLAHVINGTVEPNGRQREFLLFAPSNENKIHNAISTMAGFNGDYVKEMLRT